MAKQTSSPKATRNARQRTGAAKSRAAPDAPPDDRAIARAALRLIAQRGWALLPLAEVAHAVGLPAEDLAKRVKTTNGLVLLIGRLIGDETAASAGDPSGSVHDRLFDVLMARFDAMQTYRPAILAMERAAARDPGLVRALTCATRDGMIRIADNLTIGTLPPRIVLRIGVTAIYGAAYYAWRRDETTDLARTMAALDRALRWAGRLAARLPV